MSYRDLSQSTESTITSHHRRIKVLPLRGGSPEAPYSSIHNVPSASTVCLSIRCMRQLLVPPSIPSSRRHSWLGRLVLYDVINLLNASHHAINIVHNVTNVENNFSLYLLQSNGVCMTSENVVYFNQYLAVLHMFYILIFRGGSFQWTGVVLQFYTLRYCIFIRHCEFRVFYIIYPARLGRPKGYICCAEITFFHLVFNGPLETNYLR